jgi:hypothetical protein
MIASEWFSVAPSPDVLFSDMGDGAILFDLNTKQYYSLGASAAAAWTHLENGGSLAELEAALATVPAVSAGEDPYGLRGFVSYLLNERLVEPAEPGAASGVAPELPASWSAPKVEQHGNPLSEVILSPFDPTVPIPE